RAAAAARYRGDQDRACVPRPSPRDLGNAEGRGAPGLRPDRRRLTARDVIALRLRTATLRWARWPTRRNLMLSKRTLLIAGGVALAFAWSGESANAQGVFTITSPSFKDGERLATKNAGNNKQNPNCVGDNVSPALSWANPPAGTKSYALLMFDPEGRPPGGVSHWVAYGIPVSVTGFAEGEVSKQTEKYVGGKSLMGLPHYFGPCTPPGAPHHYTFTLIATDLEPNALEPGLT